jgi:hypothetical protein
VQPIQKNAGIQNENIREHGKERENRDMERLAILKELKKFYLNEEETKSFIDVHESLEKEKEKKIEKKENSIFKSLKDYLWN